MTSRSRVVSRGVAAAAALASRRASPALARASPAMSSRLGGGRHRADDDDRDRRRRPIDRGAVLDASRGFAAASAAPRWTPTAGSSSSSAASSSSSSFSSSAAGSSSSDQTTTPATKTSVGRPSPSDGLETRVLYRGPWLLTFRALVRFKVFQLMGSSAAIVPLVAYLNDDPLSAGTMAAVGGVLVGTAASSYALQFYAERFVGELSLVWKDPARPGGGISTLDFWGNRVNEDVDVTSIVPPLRDASEDALHEMARAMFVPLELTGGPEKQHVLSLRHGELRDKTRLFKLLSGREVDVPSGGGGGGGGGEKKKEK